MDKSLFFLFLSFVLFWLVFEDLFGSKKHISSIVKNMIPTIPSVGDVVKEKVKETVKEVKPKKNDGKMPYYDNSPVMK